MCGPIGWEGGMVLAECQGKDAAFSWSDGEGLIMVAGERWKDTGKYVRDIITLKMPLCWPFDISYYLKFYVGYCHKQCLASQLVSSNVPLDLYRWGLVPG